MTNLLIRLFIKDYKNLAEPQVRERYGAFAGITGIVSNLLLFAIKIAVGTVFNSIAVTADAVNNLSDSGASLVALFGFKLSGKPADAQHPYGHARIEYISGLIISFIVIILGVQLVQGSVIKIINPEEVQFSYVLVFALVSFNISFSGVMKDSELISSHQALGSQAQFEDLEIEFPDGATLAGTFFFASLTITGEFNDAITIEGEFQSSGLATFTPAS